MDDKYIIIIICIIALVLGIFIGYASGTYFTIKAVAEVGRNFMDEEIITEAIFRYKNHISGCYAPLNAS